MISLIIIMQYLPLCILAYHLSNKIEDSKSIKIPVDTLLTESEWIQKYNYITATEEVVKLKEKEVGKTKEGLAFNMSMKKNQIEIKISKKIGESACIYCVFRVHSKLIVSSCFGIFFTISIIFIYIKKKKQIRNIEQKK